MSRCYHCDKRNPGPDHAHETRTVRDGRPVLVITYGGRCPLGGDPDQRGEGATRTVVRRWDKGSARTAGPVKAAGVATIRTDAGDYDPPGCAAGHRVTRAVQCSGCGVVYCTGPGCLEGATRKDGEARVHRCPSHRHGPECYPQTGDGAAPTCGHATERERVLAERRAAYLRRLARRTAGRAR